MRDTYNAYDNSPLSASQVKTTLRAMIEAIPTEADYGQTDLFGDAITHEATVTALRRLAEMAARQADSIASSKGV